VLLILHRPLDYYDGTTLYPLDKVILG